MNQVQQNSKDFRNSDLYLVAAVLIVLGVMIIPLPTGILDVLLALNLSFSLLILELISCL